MNIKDALRKIMTEACVLFSFITAVYALIVYLVFVEQDQVLMDAGRVLLFFVFSVLFSVANGICRVKTLASALRFLIHFLISTLAFYLCFLLPVQMTPSAVFVGMILFVLGYFAVAGIFALIRSRFRKTKDANTVYERQYSKKR